MSRGTILDHQFFFEKNIFWEALDPFGSTSCPTQIDPERPWMILEKTFFDIFSTPQSWSKSCEKVMQKSWKTYEKKFIENV